MKVEREIAAFAFPFAAGVTAAVIMGASPCIINPTYPALALTAAFLSAALLLCPHRPQWSHQAQWSIVVLCAAACGIFIGISESEMKVSDLDNRSYILWAQNAGSWIKETIDSMAFERCSTNGMIKALLTGDRSGINPETAKAFRDSGASHILALSGLHLGIIYGIISKMLSFAGNSPSMRRARSVLIIAICGLYTLATGAGASITRALLFIILKELAETTGRNASLKRILAVSLILHLAFSPDSATDVGFQLSYAAIFGIAYIFPHLRKVWKNDWKGLRWIWESAALSISCQLTTGPLAYCYFGTFPQYFLLTNLISIPLAGMIIPLALLATVLTVAGICPEIILRTTEWLTQAMCEALGIIASL